VSAPTADAVSRDVIIPSTDLARTAGSGSDIGDAQCAWFITLGILIPFALAASK